MERFSSLNTRGSSDGGEEVDTHSFRLITRDSLDKDAIRIRWVTLNGAYILTEEHTTVSMQESDSVPVAQRYPALLSRYQHKT